MRKSLGGLVNHNLHERTSSPEERTWPDLHSSGRSYCASSSIKSYQLAHLRAQVPATAGHEHLTEVACVDVPPGKKRPEFGCFNIGAVTALHFSGASVYWHLRAFPNRQAAETAKSATGIVVEEDGRVWLSEFGPRNAAPRRVRLSPSSGRSSFPQQRATRRFSRTLSCGRATSRGCIHTQAPKAGTCWQESSVWRLRRALTGLGREEQ